MAPSLYIILAVLWQSEGLAWLSVVLPLHAQVFGSWCISTKPAISGFPIKTKTQNDIKNTPQALECLSLRYSALLRAFSVILEGVFISRDFGNY
jgi:hypothetical protein